MTCETVHSPCFILVMFADVAAAEGITHNWPEYQPIILQLITVVFCVIGGANEVSCADMLLLGIRRCSGLVKALTCGGLVHSNLSEVCLS